MRAGYIGRVPAVTLRSLLPHLPVQSARGNLDVPLTGIVYDSRDAERGSLFVAMGGLHTDGARYMQDAARRGAVAVLHGPGTAAVPDGLAAVQVENPRTALSRLAAGFFNHPSREIRVIGVTGTDGKSSTVWFIDQLLTLAGKRSGFLSTVSFKTGDALEKNPFRQSTPEASEIHGMLRGMVTAGKEFAVVEATSHGLSARMNRLADVVFDAAVLTNVTHEHLEFHGSFEQYRSDKANLFRALSVDASKEVACPRFGVVNADDPSAEYFRAAARVPVFCYSASRPHGPLPPERGGAADMAAGSLRSDIRGTTFLLQCAGKSAEARINIPGPFWVDNSTAACLTVGKILEVDPLSLAPFLARLTSVPGRMDYVNQGQPYAVIVDYAHTPGAFKRLFPWVRAHTGGRVTAVFGSAGERDPAKRPMQGRVAAEHCDVVVITEEDRRGEDTMAIMEQIAAGCERKTRGKDLFLIPDRREAIRYALSQAQPGDTVLLLGKGHEGSIIGPAGPAPWDERAEAVSALAALGFGG